MRRLLLPISCAIACHASPAPSPPATTPPPPTTTATTPPAKVLKFTVIATGRPAGDAELRIEADGRRVAHYTYNDRGRGPDINETTLVDDKGLPRSYVASGNDYFKAPVDEKLASTDATLAWTTTGDKGEAAAGSGFYIPSAESLTALPLLAQTLRTLPDHRVKLLPAGEAWLEADVVHDLAAGRLHQVAVAGLGFEPQIVWLDDAGELFATVNAWQSTTRTGSEAIATELLAADEKWATARARTIAQQLAHRPPAAGLAITHARLFDSVRRTIVPDATVIIVGDKITKVGDARTAIPKGAQVIDAHGRTLIPGLWDMHVHELSAADGLLQLASGVTTVRDLGNDMKGLAARIARFDAGEELGPRVLRAGLIDGKSKFSAPTGVFVEDEAQAKAAVATYADAGYQQIKIYSSTPPALVPVIAKAAHARGLRVSGHVPTTMNVVDAVEAGFDEIQHINMLFLRFLATKDDDTRTPLRFTRVAERATELDLDGPEVRGFLDFLVAHKTVLDPTLATFHGMFVSDPDDLNPIIVPYAKRLPAQTLRVERGGGLPAPGDKRAQFRKSFAAMQQLVFRAWQRKIPIVAGSDEIAGLTIPHELELYVGAGIPAPDVLALASLGSARVMGKDRETGSITVGKQADLVLLDGDPTRDIAAVRNTDLVVSRGVMFDPNELFAAVGVRAR